MTVVAQAEVPRVTTDIPPVHSLVASVMGDLGEPSLLLEGTGSVHAYALRPSQARQLQDSDVVIWVGAGLSPWLASELPVLAGQARSLELMALPGTHRVSARDGFALDEAHGHEHDHGHDDEDQGDPHGWLDTRNAAHWLDVIATTLSELDEPNAARYRENAAAALAGLQTLEERTEARLAGLHDRPFVMLHDALGHFEYRFGLHARAALTDSDAQAAGPRRTQSVRDTLRSLSAPCLFIETGTSRASWAPLVDGLPIEPVVLDPLGLTLDPGPALYEQLVTSLGDSIGTCLTGDA